MAAATGGRVNKKCCLKCKINVKNGENALQCDGFCENWFHIACINVEETQYQQIKEIEDIVLWMCANCKKQLKNLRTLTNLTKNTENIDIEDSLNKIENSCQIIIENQLASKTNLTYAQIASQSQENITRTKKKQNNEISHKKTIIIKPKNEQNKEETKKDILNHINPTTAKAPIKYFRTTNRGIAIIKSDCPENAENLGKHAIEVLEERYNIQIQNQVNPGLKIVGLNKEYTDNCELINDLRMLNSKLITEKDKMNIRFVSQSKKTKKWTIFVKTSGHTYYKLVNQTLDVGWGHCHVYEDLNLKRCYKCCKFGHKTTECRLEQVCSYCGGKHERKLCKKENMQCINCLYVKTKYDATRDAVHDSESDECPILNNKIKLARERINYEALLD